MDKEIIKKLNELHDHYENEETTLYIDYLTKKIIFYKEQLNILINKKPYWFQKRKFKKYNDKKREYENIILNCYELIGKNLK